MFTDLQKIVFIFSIAILVGCFAPLIEVSSPMLGNMASMSPSIFSAISIVKSQSDDTLLITFVVSIILIPFVMSIVYLVLAALKKYEWLFPFGLAFTILCFSMLYVINQKIGGSMDSSFDMTEPNVKLGWAWACFIISGIVITVVGAISLFKSTPASK